MKNIVFALLISILSVTSYAGNGFGSGGKVDAFIAMKPSMLRPIDLPNSVKLPDQVYYMRQKQAEIQFATNNAGDNKVEIQSLRPEEISNPALLEGLKRSQQSKQWENIELSNQPNQKEIEAAIGRMFGN